MKDVIEQLEAKRSAARMGGGEARIAAQHGKGKLFDENGDLHLVGKSHWEGG